MSRTTLIILAVLAAVFAGLTGLALQKGVFRQETQTIAVGGPFHLVDQTGKPTDQGVLKGKWSAVFFGFTYCPEACPTTLLALGQTEKLLGAKSKDFQTVFISVDPGRDTAPVMARYLSNSAFPRAVVGLTGADAEVARAARAYHVFYQKAGQGTDYQVNHSTITYLMGPKGDLVCFIPYATPPEVMARKISAAMAQGPNASSC